jgi:hypothetical protein
MPAPSVHGHSVDAAASFPKEAMGATGAEEIGG